MLRLLVCCLVQNFSSPLLFMAYIIIAYSMVAMLLQTDLAFVKKSVSFCNIFRLSTRPIYYFKPHLNYLVLWCQGTLLYLNCHNLLDIRDIAMIFSVDLYEINSKKSAIIAHILSLGQQAYHFQFQT